MRSLQLGKFKEAWSRLSSADQFYLPILAANVLVFALWRVPSLRPRMLRSFAANPYGRKCNFTRIRAPDTNSKIFYRFIEAPCRSMLLSTFSHYSFFHIFANMYVLHSFGSAVCQVLGKEQTLFLYVTAGLVASYASYIHKVFLGIGGASLGAVSPNLFVIDSLN